MDLDAHGLPGLQLNVLLRLNPQAQPSRCSMPRQSGLPLFLPPAPSLVPPPLSSRRALRGPERSEVPSVARARAWRGSASASETSRRGRRRDFSGGLGDTIHVAALTTWALSCRRRASFLVAVPVESRSVSVRHHPGPWGSVVGPGGRACELSCVGRAPGLSQGQGVLRVRDSMARGLRCGRSPRRDWSQAKRADSDHRALSCPAASAPAIVSRAPGKLRV